MLVRGNNLVECEKKKLHEIICSASLVTAFITQQHQTKQNKKPSQSCNVIGHWAVRLRLRRDQISALTYSVVKIFVYTKFL